MTEQQIILSIQTKRLKLSFWEKVSHFGIVAFLLITPLTLAFFHLKDAINGNPQSLREGEIYFFTIPTLVGVFFYILQSNRLKFTEINSSLSRTQLNDIIEKVGTELKWFPEKTSKHIFIAKTHPPFLSGSWGERITIIFATNRILVNSICDPDKKSSVISMGRNKKNISALVKAIEGLEK